MCVCVCERERERERENSLWVEKILRGPELITGTQFNDLKYYSDTNNSIDSLLNVFIFCYLKSIILHNINPLSLSLSLYIYIYIYIYISLKKKPKTG